MMDVVIVSDAKTDALRDMTLKAVESCGDQNIIVVESSDIQWAGCITVKPNEPFNYNRYLNIGATYGDGEFIGFFNNDVIFHKGWEDIANEMNAFAINSASPYCPRYHKRIPRNRLMLKGVTIGRELAGWALILRRSWWKRMGGFDEEGLFWTADDRYVRQLKQHKETHALITSSVVEHLGERTLETVPIPKRREMTVGQVKAFNRKFNERLLGMGK